VAYAQDMSGQAGTVAQRPDFAWRSGRNECSVYPWGVRWAGLGAHGHASWADINHLRKGHHDYTTSVRGGGTIICAVQLTYVLGLADGTLVTFSDVLPALFRSKHRGAADLTHAPGTTVQVNIDHLGRLLEQGLTAAALPAALDSCRAGETVPFGPVAVSPAGLALPERFLPWAAVRSIWISSEWSVAVKVSGELLPVSLPVQDIPSYCVFVALVSTILSG
jgi:Family of unknown function (DUF6585)